MIPVATSLPRPARQRLAWLTGGMTVKKTPIFHQHNLGAAAAACGRPVKDTISLFDMNMTDLNLVNYHPVFHADHAHRRPKNIVLTGLVFAPSVGDFDKDIIAYMTSGPRHSILATMGSSGTEDFLFEAIKAFRLHKEDDWKAVVLAAPSICAVEKAQEVAARDPRLLVTQRFIPALTANALVDVAVIHGGQGTVQTVLAAAGIRIQRQHWKPKNIRNAVRTVLDNPGYVAKARALRDTINNLDGAKTAAEVMWNFILRDEKI
ncbi:hypothetical protein DL769_010830 [Monosporascus sp. CRB-8-3]|nr:hypothetical protein DL769_010830 [Monosporascus sp. CRB-8-3]